MTSRQFSSRGQLLLVGAVALAVIILGLSVVVNTVLFTENVGTGEDRVESSEISEFTFESQRDVRSLLLRINHVNETRTVSELNANVRRRIADYSDGMARMYASSGSKFVDVSYNQTLITATRIVQNNDRNFTYSSRGATVSNWSFTDDRVDIGWFVVNVDLRNTSGEHTTIKVNGESEAISYQLNRSDGGNGADLRVQTTYAGGSDTTACESTGGRVLLDLRSGKAFASECTFRGIETLSPPYSVNVSNGDNIEGQYDLAVDTEWSKDIDTEAANGSTDDYSACSPGDPGPCLSPIVWKGQVDLTYRSDQTDFTTTRNVSVYGS
ncbi:DUF7261 family protein [Halapricum desulfuricans]|uniref:DUF7261 family protein n=1 Tax=Halapricum desulfuricans TaxID=2841257 RepID=UPI001E598998|nr:hypothetical protein [Halapricum desulfuricans]